MYRKRMISSLLSVALLSAPLFPEKGAAEAIFSDIDGSYAKDAIIQLAQAGIINGVQEGIFNPTGKLKREDFAIILAKALKLDVSNVPATPTFSDVPPSSYAYTYVEAAVKAGIIQGTGNGAFGAGKSLSRQDMAVLYVRALGVDTTGKSAALTFADSDQISGYAKDAIGAAVELGLINGVGNNTFNPKEEVDRQAVAMISTAFLKKQDTTRNSGPSQSQSEQKPQPTPEPVVNTEPVVSSSGSGRRNHGDTTPPTVDVSKLTVIDNYNGTPDQLTGAAGAVGEANVAVQAYLWSDQNANNIVDAAELGAAISLGTSAADGSVAAANIGDLAAGTYTFVVTATDASNNESARDAAHAVTMVLEKSAVPDTTVPTVDVSKFTATDNYNGTQDQLSGAAGAIGEAGATVRAYRWTDSNADNIVDAAELGAAISLGTSAADGSVAAANIGDLAAGTYTFVVTATDASNNESAKDAAHAVIVVLEKNALLDTTPPTVDSSKFTAVDNYNGSQDQLAGATGAIGEAGATVRAYRWTDSNANNIVDAAELGAAISLGTSAADGSVAAANIEDLAAGTYTFVVTATDASNNESAKDAAHAVIIVLEKNAVPDTTPPTVDSSKFTAVDNYNGTQDQLSGAEGAIGEADATVLAYRWTDSNADNNVDAGELAAAITLGASQADGSVLSAQIGDLPSGSYKFIITATDSSNNESAKDAAHVITITLVNGIQPTVTMYTYGFDGGGTGMHTKQLNAGSTAASIRFDFFPGETIVNGVMVLNFEGITVTTNDLYHAGSWTNYTSSQISNDGHTVTLTGVNRISRQDIAFMLYNKVIPAPGTYYITCTIDADGPGNTRTESVEHKIAIISVAP